MRLTKVDPEAPQRELLKEAAELLRSGQLVAFPTETVYGLGAHALDEAAVRLIYEAKGRPSVNPLIVHVASPKAARELALEWTAAANALAMAFWPGPLTLVVRKRGIIPDLVTAGGDTVGLRVPSHPVALALLEEAGVPVAAPSANLSTQVSPTTADHVVRGLGERGGVALVVDGGPTSVGIESTVVDVTGAVPRVLRPGMISHESIKSVAGAVEIATQVEPGESAKSPGMMGRHYAPRARVRLFNRDEMDAVLRDARDAARQGERVGAMVFVSLGVEGIHEHIMVPNPAGYARLLYATFHEMDDARCDLVLVERPPAGAEWDAIRDRLERATR
ncbi:MAG TPA: L-threonylcarbamoyladenylate synthase [Gemmatimonadaceae bacterium]|nr:L-threonylcarbamoyladenylate synthase [Gemmatimonadaceae bacterium]